MAAESAFIFPINFVYKKDMTESGAAKSYFNRA